MFPFAEKPLSLAPMVVLDTETTGLHPGLGHRVVELGAVRLEGGAVVAEYSQLIQPGRKMDPGASRVNGIYDEDLREMPAFAEILPQVRRLLDGALLVAHNASFDAEFLGMEFAIASSHGLISENVLVLPNPWLCTLQLARRQFYFGQNSLEQIARHLGVRAGRAHRALSDVYTTLEIVKRMARELAKRGTNTVADLLHAQGGAIYAPPPPQITLPQPIITALNEGRSLQILYVGPKGETARTISPLYPTTYNGVEYLVAYCHLRQSQRTFRLDRIFDMTLL